MRTVARSIDTYCPADDLAARHPGWDIQLLRDLPSEVGEVFLPQRRSLFLSKEMHDQDPDLVLAHAIAHLDLHPIGGPFSKAQEEEATMLAEWRLDRPAARDEWPAVDGEATVPRPSL